MIDPMDTLVKLQEAIDYGQVVLRPGEIHRDVGMWMDAPAGNTRITYAKVNGGKVQAIAIFALNGYIEGLPCFQTGYAVLERMRQNGLASDLVSKGIEEMCNGFGRSGAKRFYVEAVVGVTNTASKKLAKRLLSDTPEAITDKFSGEQALRYVKLVECGS